MKKWMSMLLVLALLVGAASMASAAESDKLNDFATRLKKAAQDKTDEAPAEDATAEEVLGLCFGPEMRINDPFYQKVRTSAYLSEDKYSREANVMIEVKNVSGRTLYPNSAAIVVYNAAGEVIDEETYAYCGPKRVDDGASLFIWDWFYGIDVPLADIAYFEVTVESDTSSYTDYEKIDAQALVANGIAYALVENTLDTDIYGLEATIVIEDANGQLLDVCESYVGNAVGLIPGSTMILRDNAEDFASGGYLADGNATAYVLYQKD